jgi:hypothetical protein
MSARTVPSRTRRVCGAIRVRRAERVLRLREKADAPVVGRPRTAAHRCPQRDGLIAVGGQHRIHHEQLTVAHHRLRRDRDLRQRGHRPEGAEHAGVVELGGEHLARVGLAIVDPVDDVQRAAVARGAALGHRARHAPGELPRPDRAVGSDTCGVDLVGLDEVIALFVVAADHNDPVRDRSAAMIRARGRQRRRRLPCVDHASSSPVATLPGGGGGGSIGSTESVHAPTTNTINDRHIIGAHSSAHGARRASAELQQLFAIAVVAKRRQY